MTFEEGLSKGDVSIQMGGDAVAERQSFIIQWESVIQSFELGMLFIMGGIQAGNPESAIHKLDIEVLAKINFQKLWDRKEPNFFKWIQQLHALHGVPISDSIIDTCEKEVCTHIYNDTTGILFEVSPKLSFLNGIEKIYSDDRAKKIIFVLDSGIAEKCKSTPAQLLLDHFVDQRINCPVGIDYRTTTFHEYVDTYRKENLIGNHVIVTTDVKVLYNSIEAKDFKNVTIIFPDFPGLNIDPSMVSYLGTVCYDNEYIMYQQKPYK